MENTRRKSDPTVADAGLPSWPVRSRRSSGWRFSGAREQRPLAEASLRPGPLATAMRSEPSNLALRLQQARARLMQINEGLREVTEDLRMVRASLPPSGNEADADEGVERRN